MLSCFTLLRIVPNVSFFSASFFFKKKEGPTFSSLKKKKSLAKWFLLFKAGFDSGNARWSGENIYWC